MIRVVIAGTVLWRCPGCRAFEVLDFDPGSIKGLLSGPLTTLLDVLRGMPDDSGALSQHGVSLPINLPGDLGLTLSVSATPIYTQAPRVRTLLMVYSGYFVRLGRLQDWIRSELQGLQQLVIVDGWNDHHTSHGASYVLDLPPPPALRLAQCRYVEAGAGVLDNYHPVQAELRRFSDRFRAALAARAEVADGGG